MRHSSPLELLFSGTGDEALASAAELADMFVSTFDETNLWLCAEPKTTE